MPENADVLYGLGTIPTQLVLLLAVDAGSVRMRIGRRKSSRRPGAGTVLPVLLISSVSEYEK